MDDNQLYPLGLTYAQLQLVQSCIAHELHRVQGRAKDTRLGDETRAAETANLQTLRGLQDKLRRLRGE